MPETFIPYMSRQTVTFCSYYTGIICETSGTNTHTFNSSQKSGSENHVSSTTTLEVKGLPLYKTAPMEDVKTTLLIVGNFVHDLRTLSVPFTAGSISSA